MFALWALRPAADGRAAPRTATGASQDGLADGVKVGNTPAFDAIGTNARQRKLNPWCFTPWLGDCCCCFVLGLARYPTAILF